MNQGQHNANDGGPFGYEFHSSNNNPNQPPSGPPLLNDNDSVLLRNFFENPNDFDPNYFTLQNAFQTDANQHIFGNHAPDWLLNLGQQSANAQTNISAARHLQTQFQNQGQSQAGYQDFSASASTQGQASPSEDVYAAARYLQQQSPASQRSSSQNYQYSNPQQHAQGSAHSMYNYSPHTPQSGSSYTFGQFGSSNGYYNASPATDQQNYGANVGYGNNLTEGRQNIGPDTRQGPLKFGSDEKFQSPRYGGHPEEHPDAQLTDILNHHIQQNNGQSVPPSSTSSTARSKKRRSSNEAANSAGTHGSSQGTSRTPATKRRKSQGQSQNQDNDAASATGSNKSSRRSKSGRADSPRNVKRSSTASKPARENLTDDQKRSNHILSEQKRRDLIKNGFEDINRMVPELRSGGFSKSSMLLEAAKFMRELRDGNEELKARLAGIENG